MTTSQDPANKELRRAEQFDLGELTPEQNRSRAMKAYERAISMGIKPEKAAKMYNINFAKPDVLAP
jgi:hypothetical protein